MSWGGTEFIELRQKLKAEMRRKLRFIGVFGIPTTGVSRERQWVVPLGDSLVRRRDFFKTMCGCN